jgi:hypothetical protein
MINQISVQFSLHFNLPIKKGLRLFRTILLSAFALLLTTGCSGFRTIEVPESDGEWTEGNIQPGRMYTRHDEGKYVIKPEPYSLKSKKKDPELLGPQRTYQSGTTSQTRTAKRTKRSSGMSKSSCISMIGEAKYNSYVKRYGGEKGALRRCLIIKRLRG